MIVGLGNPGPRYRGTLHNVGFEVMDELAARHGAAFGSVPAEGLGARVRGLADEVLLVKPLTFVNASGHAVRDLARFYKLPLADLLVVADDVHLPVGRLRLRRSGSAGGHNGLKSIIAELGTDAFARLRIGVGRGDPRRDLADHVLATAAPTDREMIQEATHRAADAVERFVAEGIDAAMDSFNREVVPPARED